MPFTTNKGFSVQATASNSGVWGSDGTTPTANSSNALNQGVIELLDQLLGSTTTLSLGGAATTNLTQLQTQKGMLRITGTLTGNQIISPDSGVLWIGFAFWENVTTGSYTVTITNSAGSVVLPQSRRGTMWIDTTNAPRILSSVGLTGAGDIPSGSKTIFYNSAAPTGWTAVALNDYAIKIVTAGNGGVTSGSVAYSTLFARTATDATTLTINQMPLHGHPFRLNPAVEGSSGSTGGLLLDSNAAEANFTFTGTPSTTQGEQIGGTGGGASHTHDIDMRVTTAAFTLCSKD